MMLALNALMTPKALALLVPKVTIEYFIYLLYLFRYHLVHEHALRVVLTWATTSSTTSLVLAKLALVMLSPWMASLARIELKLLWIKSMMTTGLT